MHFASPEFAYWFELALKMAVTALFVSVATIIESGHSLEPQFAGVSNSF
jgi:hypothetical protein